MKRSINALSFILVSMLSIAMVSCSDKEPQLPKEPSDKGVKVEGHGSLRNQMARDYFAFNVNSVVFNTTEVSGMTVFYLGAESNLTTTEAVVSTGHYARLVVANVDGGQNHVETDAGVSVEYYRGGELLFEATNENGADFRNHSYTAELFNNGLAAELDVEIVSRSGDSRFDVRYYGNSTRWPDSLESLADVIMKEIYVEYYFGRADSSDADQYLLICSTSPLTLTDYGEWVMLDKEGYMMQIYFHTYPQDNKLQLPAGTYRPSSQLEANTYFSGTGYHRFTWDTNTNRQVYNESPAAFSGDIVVEYDEATGLTTIRAPYIDADGRTRVMAYQGKLGSFYDVNAATVLPQLNESVEFNAVSADGIYYGQMGTEAYGTCEIVVYGDKYLSENADEKEGTYAATLMLTAPTLFTSQDELNAGLSKLAGTYKESSTFTKTWTWFQTVEMNVYGMVYPYGTFIHKQDGSYYGLHGYAESGTVVVTAVEGGLRIEFDLVSKNGSTMKGSYEGPINWTWSPVASSSDDGTSTLTEDYEMDLSRHKTARLVAPDKIYIGGVGYTDMSIYATKWGSKSVNRNADIGYQYIAFGNIGANKDEDGNINKGDFAYIELCTAPGEERQLKPGHYTVSQERWPAYFRPMNEEGEGVAIRGMLLNSTSYTSHWQHHIAGQTLSIMDGHAYFYDGEVTVTYNEADDTYTFEFDCICVRKHHVTGTWTGKVAGVSNAEEAALTSEWHAPLSLPVLSYARPVLDSELQSELVRSASERTALKR